MIGPSPLMRDAQSRWMVDVANWWRSTSTTDGGGGSSIVWALHGTVNTTLAPPSSSEREAAAQQGLEVTHVATVPLHVAVTRGDRLVVRGMTIEVVYVEAGTHSSVQRVLGREEPWDEPLS